jgi:Fe-S cluster assembly protein SufD
LPVGLKEIEVMVDTKRVKRKAIVKTHKPTAFQFRQQDVEAVSARIGEPDWMLERRKKAWDYWQSQSIPSTSEEPWRRTDLRSLPVGEVSLGSAQNRQVDQALLKPLTGEEGPLMVLQPGHPPRIEGFNGRAKHGVVFADWLTAIRDHADVLQSYLGTCVPDTEGIFASGTTALGSEGVLIFVPKGVKVAEPLHTVFWGPGSSTAFFSRVLVVLEEGAELTCVYESASPTDDTGEVIHAGIVELIVHAEAKLRFVELQNWGKHVWNFTHERARVGRDAQIDWVFGAVGSKLTKNFSELSLDGEGSEGRMSGFYFVDGDQHMDHDTQQNHMAPNTTSDLLFKGALVDQSRSVWQGMIYVAPGAQNTDGYQANRNLVLSKKARADSIPGLEILADDVRCTHGATVSQLEEEPVFYLMSRGIHREDAERLVVEGFFDEIMIRIPFKGVRARFEQMIDNKLR